MNNESVPPVIINGMFRSGTSLIWRVLKTDSRFDKAFYEPLHPHSFSERPPEISKPYYQNDVTRHWSSRFAFEKIYMSRSDGFPDLRDYLNDIIKDNSILKFTRLNLRLDWVMAHFPNVFVINIVRDPRDVCLSYMNRGNLDFTYKANLKQTYRKQIKKKPSTYYYREYLQSIKHIPKWNIYIRKLNGLPEYIKILGLWKINVTEAFHALNNIDSSRYITIRHEDFCRDTIKTLKKIYDKMNLSIDPKVEEEVYEPTDGMSIKITGHKFHMNISTEWINKWKEIDKKLWQKGINKAGLRDLMDKFNYRLD